MKGRLEIDFLGNLELRYEGKRLGPIPTRRTRALLGYLIINRGQMFPREELRSLLYRDRVEHLARRSFRTELWRLRKCLRGTGLEASRFIAESAGNIGFRVDAPVRVDYERFLHSLEKAKKADSTDHEWRYLNAAVHLYRGTLLAGIYDDWCLNFREHLRMLYVEALEQIMGLAIDRKNWQQAIDRGQEIIVLDDLAEHVHRDLMLCYWKRGNRPAAIRQFKKCERQLAAELDVRPMPETVALHAQILASKELPNNAYPSERSPMRRISFPQPRRLGKPASGKLRRRLTAAREAIDDTLRSLDKDPMS